MDMGLGYVTFLGERFQTDYPECDAIPLLAFIANPPEPNTVCYACPMRNIQPTGENSLGTLSIVTLHCVNGEYPPNDSYENMLAWEKENLDDEYYCMLKAIKVCGPLTPFRPALNDQKLVETLGKQWPQNFVLLGDAMYSFNSQFGQGMTHACRHARELDKVFADNPHTPKDVSRLYNRRAAAISEECWLGVIVNDWKTPTLKIVTTDKNDHKHVQLRNGDDALLKEDVLRAPMLLRFLQWYNYWFLRCASKSGDLATEFMSMMNQEKNPLVLFKPSTIVA